MQRFTKLSADDVVPSKTTVYLLRGYGDSRQEVEWFVTDKSWVVPETINGFWYGIPLDEPNE